ncbi:hypothetical protein R80B4_02969 [Fibrobacteres bacterium R8-0-B4]
MMNKKGMTLVELMVYIVLAAFLLAPVIMLVQNSSISMARDASNVSLRMTGREILNIIYDDLKNTGYKLNPNTFQADMAVGYMDNNPLDSSSFMPGNKVNGNYYDTLTVRMGRLSNAGAWEGIDAITYEVNNGELKRTIQGISSTTAKTIALAKNVEALKFRYSDDFVKWYDFFNDTIPDHFETKSSVQYIKVIMVTKDPKKLSATKSAVVPIIKAGDGETGYFGGEITINNQNDQALYERHEIVIPIPNNGLFP